MTTRATRKRLRYALVAELHAAGLRDTGAIALLLRISREYARLILRDRVDSCSRATDLSANV